MMLGIKHRLAPVSYKHTYIHLLIHITFLYMSQHVIIHLLIKHRLAPVSYKHTYHLLIYITTCYNTLINQTSTGSSEL